MTLKAGQEQAEYAEPMIRYHQQNALHPEKDTEISVNLTPLLFFLVGYVTVRALLGSQRHAR
ncbi:hypothetical protein [Deinococcus sp. YIM 77859]|uniref:hypothetical protein n=1 Tax=Deinococcus sp. YIM 77859 TaxID=1540221 RepID=UPI000556EB4F|nr:hypothetical protein [Deinococcus sp. YIM 77859]